MFDDENPLVDLLRIGVLSGMSWLSMKYGEQAAYKRMDEAMTKNDVEELKRKYDELLKNVGK